MGGALKVGIVGAGVGGLALAQGLRGAGLDVGVYERDPSPRHRRQGYRIHIDADGEQALADVLPEGVHRRVVATAGRPGDLVAGFDSTLTPTFEEAFPSPGPDTVNAVDRHTFRRALMTGLDDALHFGHELVGYHDRDDGRVAVRFADGRSDVVDVLVGADGTGSSVRRRLLPDFEVVDIGVRCIYGKLPLTESVRRQVPSAFLRGFCFVSGADGIGAAFGPVLFREPPEHDGDYLMVVLTGTTENLGRTDADLYAMSPHRLWTVARAHVATWHPTLRGLFAAADPAAAFPITLRSCTRVEPWPTGRVTLLGDAVHPMTPAAGAGANTALWDAARLTHALTDARDGATGVVASLAAYEHDMIEHSAPIVAESLRRAERMFALRPVV